MVQKKTFKERFVNALFFTFGGLIIAGVFWLLNLKEVALTIVALLPLGIIFTLAGFLG
jgi:hypothetical protein